MTLLQRDDVSAPADRDDDDDDAADNGSADAGDNGGPRQPVRWVTVAAFTSDPLYAHLARLRLDARDIPCFIADENITATAWHYSLAIGGAKLQVPREHLPAAEAVLTEPPEFSANVEPDEAGKLVCARCGGRDIRPSLWTSRRILGLLAICLMGLAIDPIAGLVLPAFAVVAIATSRRRRCGECGTEFDEDPRRGFEVVMAAAPAASDSQEQSPS